MRVPVKVFIMKPELKSMVQERSLKAFLGLAILCALTEHPLTGYEINRLFLKKHRLCVGPSAVYSKLAAIEKKLGRIRREQKRKSLWTNRKREKINRKNGGHNLRD